MQGPLDKPISFNTGVEGVLSNDFRPDDANFVPMDRQMRLEGGRVYQHVDQYLKISSRTERMLEFARPTIKSSVTLPSEFTLSMLATRMKLANQRNRMRDVRKRALVTRVLQVLEELDANMTQFVKNLSSLRKA